MDSNPKIRNRSDPIFQNVNNVIIASNQLAAQAALDRAKVEGLNTIFLTSYLQGEASQAGRFVAALARQIVKDGNPIPRPACIILGGETTVTLAGNGKGGRNQELALGSVGDISWPAGYRSGLPGNRWRGWPDRCCGCCRDRRNPDARSKGRSVSPRIPGSQ